jgi:hypothetical protein
MRRTQANDNAAPVNRKSTSYQLPSHDVSVC